MADSNVTSAATALEPMSSNRGRPTGSGGIETKPVDFGIEDALDALIELALQPWYARNTQYPKWDWDAKHYPHLDWDVSYSPPDMAVLNKYSELLLVLIRLARYDQPINEQSTVCLTELLTHLHTRFGIFPRYWSARHTSCWSLRDRAVAAADRWRLMCKHCLFLFTILSLIHI